MPVKMPLAVPTRTIDSIGQRKTDRVRVPNYTEYVPADEWNNVCDELIACCQVALNLAAAGATGTLQQIYNNGAGPITRILLDVVRFGIQIQDAAPSIGADEYLLSVSGPGGVPPLFRVSNNNWRLDGNSGGMRTDGAGNIRLITAGGCNLLPSEADKGQVGKASECFEQMHSLAFGTKCINVAFNAGSPSFDASKGSVQQVILTGTLNAFTVSNLRNGQHITLIFTQDGTGNRFFTAGGLPANFCLRDGRSSFSLAMAAGRSTALTFVRDPITDTVYEVGRSYNGTPADDDVVNTALSNTPVSLHPRKDPHVQIFSGTLTGPVSIDILATGAMRGDEYTFIFDETNGVTTDAMNTLTLRANGVTAPCAFNGGTAVFNQAKTLRGNVRIVYDGTNWRYSFGSSLLYT